MLNFKQILKRFPSIPPKAIEIAVKSFPDLSEALLDVSSADIPGYGMYEALDDFKELYYTLKNTSEDTIMVEDSMELTVLDSLKNSITRISKKFADIHKDKNVAIDKAVNHILTFEDEPFTSELITDMVTAAIDDSDSIYGDLNLYANDFGEFSLEELDRRLKDSPYNVVEETIDSVSLGDYKHEFGGAAGNAFYDPSANKKARPKNPVVDYTDEDKSELKSIIKRIIEEAKDEYQIYHRSYTSAVQEIENYAKKRGYELSEDEMFDSIGSGPRKPQEGVTNKFTLTLYKNGNPQKKALHAQIYGRGTEGYELNQYIS